MGKTFLGVGVGFPLDVDSAGKLTHAEYEESVRQSIWIILGTAKGERVMRPEFGCDIYDLVFAVNSLATAGKLSYAVQQALLHFEPRIDVLDVRVDSGAAENTLLLNIEYEVRATNNVFNMVYPFYLERSG
ncbi:MAG: GPW/gp25 family protein [Proteobacteria bacterium]|nr:GPW/gp25 family protein [Pseudomonadota bacterium]MBU1138881.1 GPW/gp25 family protein [Pseudomonadota bacterium]MBU1419750.1 GPW/gp25 family protein [Pseudomonadota bacterium]MBU1455898.1 GPW/gp25 family protein [Pseudomonadota bacterium]